MLQKDQLGVYTELFEEELEALETSERKLISQLVHDLSRWQDTYRVNTDACDRQIGCVRLQTRFNGHNKLIGCWSRSLAKA